MTTGQFLVAAVRVIECRGHNRLNCEPCLEEIASILGVEAWDKKICQADNVEDAIDELAMVKG